MYSLDDIRLGHLTKEFDYWYHIDEESNIESLKCEIENHIINYAIPYLERFKSIDDIINIFLKEDAQRSLYLVLIMILNGYKKEGTELFMELYNYIVIGKSSRLIDVYNRIAEMFQIDISK